MSTENHYPRQPNIKLFHPRIYPRFGFQSYPVGGATCIIVCALYHSVSGTPLKNINGMLVIYLLVIFCIVHSYSLIMSHFLVHIMPTSSIVFMHKENKKLEGLY